MPTISIMQKGETRNLRGKKGMDNGFHNFAFNCVKENKKRQLLIIFKKKTNPFNESRNYFFFLKIISIWIFFKI